MKVIRFAAVGACFLSLVSLTAHAGSFKQIKTKKKFLEIGADQTWTADWGSLIIHSNGKISGKVGEKKMVGAWNLQGKYWCRSLRIGSQEETGTDCQKLSIDGDKMQFLRNKGKGDAVVMTLGN